MNTNKKVIELLKVYLNTTGDFRSVRPVPFMDKGVVFFTTKVFLDTALLKGNAIDMRQVFLNYDVFYKAIRLLQSENYSTYTPAEIQKNNIEVFRKAFLNTKTVIPIGSKKMAIIKSKYVPDSFKPYVGTGIQKNTQPYEVRFAVTILDAVRNLTDTDFTRANCKLKASELNKQARDIFAIDLGLDDEFAPIQRSIVKPPTYANNPYATTNNPYATTNNPYATTNTPYATTNNPYATTNTPFNNTPYNNTTSELNKARRELTLLLKDLDKERERKHKEHYTSEWLNYKDQRQNEGLPPKPMSEWVAERERQHFVQAYKNDWLKYKQEQETLGRQPDVEKWRKNKLEEELVNESDFYAKKWLNYKSDQIVLGKKPIMIDWLKTEMKKYKIGESGRGADYRGADYRGADYRGGQKYRKSAKGKNKRSKKNKSKKNKRNKSKSKK
jgi:hypothetical protein